MTDQSTTPTYATREEWLTAAVNMFRPTFDRLLADFDDTIGIPDDLKVSVGFAMASAAENRHIGGVTFARECTFDKVPTVFIAPHLSDPVEAVLCLLHELIHVSDDCHANHDGVFAEIAHKLGFLKVTLEGKGGRKLYLGYAALKADEFLTLEVANIVSALGAYPHSAIDMDVLTGKRVPEPVSPSGEPLAAPLVGGKRRRWTSGQDRQTNRHKGWSCRNVQCPSWQLTRSGHGYTVNVARVFAELATPICPCCRNDLVES
jgi:hypothetical protein